MRARRAAALALALSVLASSGASRAAGDTAPGPCAPARTTRDLTDCLSRQLDEAERELARYLDASRRRFAAEPRTVEAMSKAQEAWLRFRTEHCDAVEERWSKGTIRSAASLDCRIAQTRRRTHDLWETYLTYMDTSPPLLPEPGAEARKGPPSGAGAPRP